MWDVVWIIALVKISNALSMECPRWMSPSAVEIRRLLRRSFLAEAELLGNGRNSGRASGPKSWSPFRYSRYSILEWMIIQRACSVVSLSASNAVHCFLLFENGMEFTWMNEENPVSMHWQKKRH
jgi:hypothetical protein